MDELLKHFGPSPTPPPVAQPDPDEAHMHQLPHLASADVSEWAQSVIQQQAEANQTAPEDRD